MVDAKKDEQSILDQVQPTLKFLDLEKCEVINECLKSAQSEKEAQAGFDDVGVYKNEVWKLYKKQMNIADSEKFAYFDFDEQMTNMYRSGAYFADDEFNKVSLMELPGYKKFEANHAERHVGYELSRGTGLNTKKKEQAVNLEEYIKDTLLAKHTEGQPVELKGLFLDGKDFQYKTAYTSYSRSGNTLFRKLLEQSTGIFTGSDGDLNYSLHYQLQHAGFTAEAYSDNSVWFVKTHYPLGREVFFTANKAICCVRNPFDVVSSMFNFWTTQTQNKSIADDNFHVTFADDFKKLTKSEITCWRDWHEAWLKFANEQQVFFFRFEDLTADPEKVLRDVYCFVLGIEESQLQGSVLEAAIKQISENKKDGQAVGQLYKPRKASSNSNLHRYDPEMLAWAKTELGPLLSFFGYNTEPTNFFPDVPAHSGFTYTHFKELNKVSEKNAPGQLMRLNGDDKSQGDMNVRTDCDPKDCAEGMPDRNLFNFNYLIDKVTVRD